MQGFHLDRLSTSGAFVPLDTPVFDTILTVGLLTSGAFNWVDKRTKADHTLEMFLDGYDTKSSLDILLAPLLLLFI